MKTLRDFLDVIGEHPRWRDAVYWYCQAWHNGDDDLYRIMCSLDFTPKPWSTDEFKLDSATDLMVPNSTYDPDLVMLLTKLDGVFIHDTEPPLRPVKMKDVREGHVLTADGGFPCIVGNWPCRVYKHHGALGVQCSGGVHGIKLLPGSETTFHPLQEDVEGDVIGFRR